MIYLVRPPPREQDDEPQPVKTVDPAPPPSEVIPEEEQAELDRIEKLLSKAQIARNTHRKTVSLAKFIKICSSICKNIY